jgi:ABC-type transporter MlaC component
MIPAPAYCKRLHRVERGDHLPDVRSAGPSCIVAHEAEDASRRPCVGRAKDTTHPTSRHELQRPTSSCAARTEAIRAMLSSTSRVVAPLSSTRHPRHIGRSSASAVTSGVKSRIDPFAPMAGLVASRRVSRRRLPDAARSPGGSPCRDGAVPPETFAGIKLARRGHSMRAAAIATLVMIATCGPALPTQPARAASPDAKSTAAPSTTSPAKRSPAAKQDVVVAGPGDQLRAHLQRVVTELRLPGGMRTAGRNPGQAALLAMFDLQETARRVVEGDVGNRITAAQQRELRAVLTDVLSHVVERVADYLRLARDESLERYASAPLALHELSLNEREAVVNGELPGKGGRDIDMTAWMVRRSARWLVYDLRLDDITLVESYRAQCEAMLRRSSYAVLLARLREKRDGLELREAVTARLVRPTPAPRTRAVTPRLDVLPSMAP